MKLIYGLFFAMYFHGSTAAQNNWTLQKEKDGIKISNRPSPTSSFNDVRVEVDLPGNIDQLAAILLDVNKYTEWAYATRKSELIKQLGPDKLIYYSEIEVPWPATDRYFYAQFELKKDPDGRSVRVVSTNVSYDGPVPKDLLKVPYSKGSWNVTQSSKQSIHVDYILELNPGGSLPAWVLNLFSSKGPLETFENIKRKMELLNPTN
ncbi:MAG TPA: START domain-containing protein [Puia sp.]